MDSNDRQQSPLPEQPPAAIAGVDWKSQLKDARNRIIMRIINTLNTCLPFNGQEDLQELQKIAIRFEEISFNAATDKTDYLRRISSKLSSIDSRLNVHTNAMPSNSAGMDRNPQDPAILNVQPQVQNRGQSLPIPMPSIQNSAMQGLDSNHTNTEMQIQKRRNIQHVSPQQQSQDPQENIYQQQLRQLLLKQDLHEVGTKQPLTQPHMQQQNIQMQSSQLSAVQHFPTMQPSIVPAMQQRPPSSVQRKDQQSVPVTQIHEKSQQTSVNHQMQVFQRPMLQSQQHDRQQQNPVGQNTSISDMQLQQSQSSIGQQNNIFIMHQQRLDSRIHVGQLPQQQQLLESQSGDGQQQSQQQEMMLQMPSQMAQLQQRFVSQNQRNSLESNMQPKIRTSNPLPLQQNVIEQQKTSQSQRSLAEAPSNFLDSIAHNGNSSDWQEVCYQKIKDMKELYFVELSEAYQKICVKLQQLGSLSDPKKVDKLKYFKKLLEGLLHCLQATKNSIKQYNKDKLLSLDKHIPGVLNALGARKPGSLMLQGQLPPTHMQSMQKAEQPEVQIPQIESHDSGINSHLQLRNVQGFSVSTVLPGKGSVSPAVISSQQKTMNPLQSGSNLGPLQSGSNLGLGQVSTPTSIQQNPISASQQAGINNSAPQIGMKSENSKASSLQPASSMLQSQHIKQQHEQKIMQQRRQLKEPFQQHRTHQQLQQIPQKHQPQQHMQQVKKQQHGQLQGHQIPQFQQLSDANALKMRQHIDIKPQIIVQNLSPGKKYPHQQLKPGLSFPNSSLQCPQPSSPMINQQSSPSVVSSPISLAPSLIPGDPKNLSTAVLSVSNASSIIHQHTRLSSILPEESSPDSHGNTLNIPGKTSVTQRPLERLLKVVKSMSSKTLNASVSDIGSIVSVIDRIGGCSPGDGSRAAVAEDLAAVTNYHLQARDWITQDGSIGLKRMREHTNSISLDATSSVGSPTDSFKQLTGSDREIVATSCVKRPRIEINPALLEELRKINERLIDTVIDICDKEFASEGTCVKCSFNAVTLSPRLKFHYASAKMLPIQPLRLLVPVDYPNCSPILLDKCPVAARKEYSDLYSEAHSRFSIALRTVSQPMSLMEIARTWDDCARSVICDYARRLGGGTFSTKFGTLDNWLSVA